LFAKDNSVEINGDTYELLTG